MTSVYAELHLADQVYIVRHCAYEWTQATDNRGWVVARPRPGLLRLTLDVVPGDRLLISWVATAFKVLAGLRRTYPYTRRKRPWARRLK